MKFINVKSLVVLISAAAFLIQGVRAEDTRKLKLVATISTFANIASAIGGERVETTSIAPPRFNAHSIEPRPTDVMRVKRADLFIHAGLDLELWRGPLVNAAGRADVQPGGYRELDLSPVVRLLDIPTGPVSRSDGDIHLYGNPHYWQDPRNGLAIAGLMAKKLSEIDPAHADEYEANLNNFVSRLQSKMSDWSQLLAKFQGSELIGYHNEWVYLTDFLGIKMLHFLEPKPGIPAGPRHLEFLKNYISQNSIPGIVQASFYPKKASERLAKDTSTSLQILCQNVSELDSCPNYIAMIDFNVRKISELLGNG